MDNVIQAPLGVDMLKVLNRFQAFADVLDVSWVMPQEQLCEHVPAMTPAQ